MFGDYDEDLNDERQRCLHGTFVGSWWGPDYLCGLCEMGLNVLRPVIVTAYVVAIAASNVTTGDCVEHSTRCREAQGAQTQFATAVDLLNILSDKGYTGTVTLTMATSESLEWCESSDDED